MKISGIYDASLDIPPYEASFPFKGTVLIFPGGGYEHLSDREAYPVAKAFAEHGIRSGILWYGVSGDMLGTRPLVQAAWAVSKVREWYPGEPVTVLGFSAGAHCAGSIGVHFDGVDWNGKPLFEELPNPDQRFRPDGMVLCYPVITAYQYAHEGSIRRLIGGIKDKEEYERARHFMSLEKQVGEDTPPAFLWQTAEDQAVPVQNSLLMVNALTEAHVPVELHIYPKGAHGLSLATKETEAPEFGVKADAHVAGWFEELVQWLKAVELIQPGH